MVLRRYTYVPLFVCLLFIGIIGCEESSDQGTGALEVIKPIHTQTNESAKGNKDAENQPNTKTEPPEIDPALEMLSELSLEEKVGQLVIVGMEGTSVDSYTQKLINNYHVGGFIFFKDNIASTTQAVNLFNHLKKENATNPVPLWMSIDEEGGRVSRMPESFLRLPASGVVGKKNDTALTYKMGSQIGQRLSGFGLNMAFAPVLDVNSNPNNPVIGDRSFGSNAAQVARLGTAAMKGIQEAGVVAAVKHFPGHGDTVVDSHVGLPVVNVDMNRLNKLELVPFKEAIDQGADVVMVAHLLMSKIDPKTPASYSKPIITGLLREQLGYKGVVITDDMTMGAVDNGKIELGEIAIRSVLAGSNIVLVGHEYDKEETVVKALLKAVKSKRITEKVLDERVLPILRLKMKYSIKDTFVKEPDVKLLNKNAQKLINSVK
ncbi:beta-N-acetylhexosaminidase [Paenibacillus sp. EC2-1]|uniref:beta-N-acetylhexosaminidase n=1 Tax=Paenibacillus sp. EC2-1 TaxID=3388665 RepID=UPI003BEF098F